LPQIPPDELVDRFTAYDGMPLGWPADPDLEGIIQKAENSLASMIIDS
jgi:hypothetical protein